MYDEDENENHDESLQLDQFTEEEGMRKKRRIEQGVYRQIRSLVSIVGVIFGGGKIFCDF